MAVFLAKVHKYKIDLLKNLIMQGINELGLDLKNKKSALLKPNIVNVAKPDSAKITHPMLVEAIIDVLRERGIFDIIIGDGPAVDADENRVFDVSGYSHLARRKNIQLVNFNNTESVEIEINPDGKSARIQNGADSDPLKSKYAKIRVPKLIKEVDLYINIPKLKTHVNTGVSISLKNQIGLLPLTDKKRFHLMGLHEPIAQLARVIQPELIIVDGITGSEGEAPMHGKKKKAGILAIGTDMLEVDLVCCQVIGIKPISVNHIRRLLPENGTIPQIKTLGEKADGINRMFLQPNHRCGKFLNIYSWRNPRSCPLCSIAFNHAISIAKRSPKNWFTFFPKFTYHAIFKRIDLVKGPSPEMPEDKRFIFFFGDCAEKVAETTGRPFIRGCPPTPDDMIMGLKKFCDHKSL